MIDRIIKILDNLGRVVDILLNSIFKFLDYLIKTFEEVSKKILNLITAILRLLYYIVPFILMIVVGSQKGWRWMTITGWAVIVFVSILFFRDFIAEFRGGSTPDTVQASPYSRRVFFIILILNILLVGYSVAYYVGGISPEIFVSNLFQKSKSSSQADAIREAQYLANLRGSNNDPQEILAAVRNLGELKSEAARPILIGRLAEYGVKKNHLYGNSERDIETIILALSQIGGASACSSLVQFEIRSQNTGLKAKAKKAADQICGQSRFTAK